MKKKKAIIHVGTPKTGTTSLQFAFFTSRKKLAKEGVLYPDIEVSPSLPKHQWIVKKLLEKDFYGISKNFEHINSLSCSNNLNKIILSAEGIYNHWVDFSKEAINSLVDLKNYYDITVWCVFRNPISFALSVYFQLLRNNPSKACSLYGTSMSFEESLDHPWFKLRLDYANFVRSIESAFKSCIFIASRYESIDLFSTACDLIDIDISVLKNIAYKNKSFSSIGVDLLRCLNLKKFQKTEREKILKKIEYIDRKLRNDEERFIVSTKIQNKILKITNDSEKYLKNRFSISWNL